MHQDGVWPGSVTPPGDMETLRHRRITSGITFKDAVVDIDQAGIVTARLLVNGPDSLTVPWAIGRVEQLVTAAVVVPRRPVDQLVVGFDSAGDDLGQISQSAMALGLAADDPQFGRTDRRRIGFRPRLRGAWWSEQRRWQRGTDSRDRRNT